MTRHPPWDAIHPVFRFSHATCQQPGNLCKLFGVILDEHSSPPLFGRRCLPVRTSQDPYGPTLPDRMEPPISAGDLFQRHIGSVMLSTGYIGVFIISVPIVKLMALSVEGESLLFGLLFLFCHVANWPMLQLRWTLWSRGRLTPYAAWCMTALLLGSFGIPLILLADLLG